MMNFLQVQWAADVGKRIATPTLVIWGEDDPCSPPYYTDGYHRVFTDVAFRFVAQCGHFPQEEQPAITIAAMRDFLAGKGCQP